MAQWLLAHTQNPTKHSLLYLTLLYAAKAISAMPSRMVSLALVSSPLNELRSLENGNCAVVIQSIAGLWDHVAARSDLIDGKSNVLTF